MAVADPVKEGQSFEEVPSLVKGVQGIQVDLVKEDQSLVEEILVALIKKDQSLVEEVQVDLVKIWSEVLRLPPVA